MDPDPEILIISALVFAEKTTLTLILLLLLLSCSALISGAEIAFFAIKPHDLSCEESIQKSKRLQQVIKLLEKPKKLLATILIANNSINIAIVLLFASLGDQYLSTLTTSYFGLDIRFVVEVIIVTFLILLFGEILPKIYASRNSLQFAKFMSFPLKILDVIFTPLSTPMQSVTLWIHNHLGTKKTNFNVDQLSQALELTSEEETSTDEQKILKGIVSFGNTDTKQVMRPRMDVNAIQKNATFNDVLQNIRANRFSRIPVFEESIDSIVGILYIKDILPHINKADFEWTQLLRKPYFVPENKKLDDLLNEFKALKNHLAVVVDEYGGTSGIVTLNDIIEEIVGDISNEFDDDDIQYSKLDQQNFVFEGKTSLKDFYKIIQLEDPSIFENNKGEAETIAGLILEINQGFPSKNEILKFNNYTFKIEAIDKKRIKQIKVNISA